MRFLTDTELAAIKVEREKRVAGVTDEYDWDELTITELALIRAEAQEFARLADEQIAKKVSFLRAGGDISWVELGKVLGVSKQAAQQKFS